jgi:2-beta-glucuronyltransferase
VNISLFHGEAQPAIGAAADSETSAALGCELAAESGARQRAVLISGYHDYRTGKRASIHQIADGLVRSGFDVSFISTRYSMLSRWTGDSRLFLWDRANAIETANGIDCLLWRTLAHPFSSHLKAVQSLTGYTYDWYSELPNSAFDQLVRLADYVIVESGVAAIYLRRIRRMNPRAKVIYYGADRLETINAHPFIRERLEKDQELVDHFAIRATGLMDDFPYAAGRLYKSSFGVDDDEYGKVGPSPYVPDETVAVSVGSMLFDPTVFQLVASHFPDVQFHLVGCGAGFEAPPNVHIHAEMPFDRALAFVKHASIGIAAYAPVPGAEYLAESSLKLAQFEYFGLPAVCPNFAVGCSPFRFGYEPGDEDSIRSAVAAALAKIGSAEPRSFPSWEEVALQLIEPVRYGATRIG